jgi:hypothetical protein
MRMCGTFGKLPYLSACGRQRDSIQIHGRYFDETSSASFMRSGDAHAMLESMLGISNEVELITNAGRVAP